MQKISKNLQRVNSRLTQFSVSESHHASLINFHDYTYHDQLTAEDRFKSYQLRKEIYVDEYQWSTDYKDKIEVDKFDAFSTVAAVKNPSGDVVATLRSTDAVFDWMATDCYNEIFKPVTEDLKTADINEVSRLCVSKHYRNTLINDELSVFDLLLSGMLLRNKSENVRGTVIVTHAAMYYLLKKKGFDIRMLTKPVRMEDGCKITAFYVDINRSYQTFLPLNTLMA
ncbi:MAG: GNAT family N-acetyltransferase [Cellvibrionales bacterium]|nr:GNAT family N-acetyltransferase [Cellvibrionales bacterium]